MGDLTWVSLGRGFYIVILCDLCSCRLLYLNWSGCSAKLLALRLHVLVVPYSELK